MTSPHGSGGEPTPSLAVYDLHAAPSRNGLPVALGQLVLAIGVATLLFGLWALASTTLTEDEAVAEDATAERLISDDEGSGTGERSSAGAGGTGEGEGDGDAGPGDAEPEARFDCNEDRTVCRFTSPEGFETYVCIEPCVLPDWLPDDAFVIPLTEADGIEGTDFGVDPRGALLPLPAEHNAASFIRFVVRPDGGIGLITIGDGEIPIRFGALEPQAGTRTADPEASTESEDDETADHDETSEDDQATADDSESALSLRGLAPLLILLGVGLIIVAAVILMQAAKRRADEVEAQDDLLHQPPPPDASPEDDPFDDDVDLARRNTQVAELRVKKITDLIAELRADPDPARAIQRAYAALETGFGNPALSRKPSETCSTYLHRTIGVVGGVSQPLRTLTTLFELARFSDATIDEQMRADAIDALVLVRDAWQSRAGRRDASAPNDSNDEPKTFSS